MNATRSIKAYIILHVNLLFGVPGRIQTYDTEGRNLMLYSLSYGDVFGWPCWILTSDQSIMSGTL
jgi:hypothetical protein